MIDKTYDHQKKPLIATIIALGALILLPLLSPPAAMAGELKTFTKKGAFDTISFDVENAIIEKGLVIDTKGDVGAMLKRTGADVGSAKELYVGAKYFAFCSAVLSRKMMEADPENMGLCPYIVFVYELKSDPGTVIAGYRSVGERGNDASEDALKAVDEMLEGIVKSALE